MSTEELEKRIEEALDEGWSAGDDSAEFYPMDAVAAVMSIPLIAAAPEMLAALKAVENFLSSHNVTDYFSDEELSQLQAVIAKAEHGT